jgi:4'-phosphopantetheinyl transferase
VQGGHKSSSGPDAVERGPRSDLEIVFVDLIRFAEDLAREETRTPRLSADDNARAEAMVDHDARRLWRAARIATRIVLERVVGESVRAVPFRIEPGGRPVLADGGAHFSVSHSAGAALIAVAREMAVGVDIERKARIPKMSEDRRSRVLDAAARFQGTPARSGADADVLEAWVQLEAIAKARGTGIGRLLTEEGVIGGKAKSPAAIDAPDAFAVKLLTVDEGFVAAIAAPRLPNDIVVESFSLERPGSFRRCEAD